MSNDIDWSRITVRERAEIARTMITPLRCGGMDYVEGELYIRIQGWLIPYEIIEQSRKEHNGDPWPGICAYQASNEPENRR